MFSICVQLFTFTVFLDLNFHIQETFERLLPSSSHVTLIRSQSSPRDHEIIPCAGVGSMDYNLTLQTELPCLEEQKVTN